STPPGMTLARNSKKSSLSRSSALARAGSPSRDARALLWNHTGGSGAANQYSPLRMPSNDWTWYSMRSRQHSGFPKDAGNQDRDSEDFFEFRASVIPGGVDG